MCYPRRRFSDVRKIVNMCGAHYVLCQHLVSTQGRTVLPDLHTLRAYFSQCLLRCPRGRHLLHLVKSVPRVLLNSSVGVAVQHMEQAGFFPDYDLRCLLERISGARGGFLAACRQFSITREHYRVGPRNLVYYLLEAVEVRFMRRFVSELLECAPVRSCVFIHDGIYVAPQPHSSLLEHCSRVAAHSLGISPPPVVLLKISLLQAHFESSTFHSAERHSDLLPPAVTDNTVRPVRPPPSGMITRATLHQYWNRRHSA